jgi:hypothetical protein
VETHHLITHRVRVTPSNSPYSCKIKRIKVLVVIRNLLLGNFVRQILIILSIIFSFTVSSCTDKEESNTANTTVTTVDTTSPIVAEVTEVTTPTNDSTPDYTFSSDDAGTITYGGSCSSNTSLASSGNNKITLVSLSDGTYSDCTIVVIDSAGNTSNTLTITSFTVDSTAATLTEVTAVTTPTNDSTPDYTFYSSTSGTITYGGSCSSSTTSAVSGNNTITLESLSDGTYSDCTVTVTDSASNSVTLNMSSFSVIGQMGGSIQGAELSLSTVVTTLAGTGSSGSSNGTGTSASFYFPFGITTDGTNLYVADMGNHLIRQIE